MQPEELGVVDSAAVVKAEIEHILSLPPGEIRVLWRKRFRKNAPPTLSVQMLVRMLAWKVQEEAFGGHDAETLKLLKAFARKDASKVMLFSKLKPGTALVREYQGKSHEVTIGDDSFMWNGRAYNSLSAIALAITGVNWNGPRFFGLRGPHTAGIERRSS